MCVICDQYKLGKIDGKVAMKQMGDQIAAEKNPNKAGKLTSHAFELSEIILAKEVPETQTNREVEEAFWNATHQED